MITYRDLGDAETLDGSLDDQFHRPAVSGFFQINRAEDIGARSAERTEVADLYPVEVTDQACCQPVAEQRVPGKRSRRARTRETRTDGDVRPTLDDGSEEKRKLGGSIAVVPIQKDDDIGRVRSGQPR